MEAHEERTLKRMCQRALGLRQGKPGSGARAFARRCGCALSTVLNELNPHPIRNGRGFVKLGVARLVALCRFARDPRPVAYLARLVRASVRAGAAVRTAGRRHGAAQEREAAA